MTEDDIKNMKKEIEEEDSENEDDETQQDDEQQAPAQQAPVPVIVQNQEQRTFDDSDQKELAKSMTKFFGTLVEEANSEPKKE